MSLVHVTALAHLKSIAETGLRERAYFIDAKHDDAESLIEYYSETIRDEGEEPILLIVSETVMDQKHMDADMPGIDEPITTALNLSEDEIQEEWADSDQSASASREIIGSMRYLATIPPSEIKVALNGLGNGYEPLIDVIKPHADAPAPVSPTQARAPAGPAL